MPHREMLLIAVFGMMILCGCKHSIRIKAVDSATGKPLAGVATEWRQHRHQITGPIAHTGPIRLRFSDDDGLIKVNGKYRNWISEFVFTHPGYSEIYARYGTGREMVVGDKVSRIDSGQLEGEFRFDGETQTVIRDDSMFVLPLKRK